MARPTKTGLDYYSTDTNRYLDIKIKRLRKDFSCVGIAVWDYILNEIYRVEGSFLKWDEYTAFDVADYFGIKETTVNEVVNYCCSVGLLNKELYTSEKILTSKVIQERYVKVCKDAKRTNINLPMEIDLISFYENKPELIQEETKLIQEETKFLPPKSTQSKVKESKVKKIKESSPKSPTDLIIERMSKYAAQCIDDRRWVEEVCMNVGLPSIESEKSRFKIRLWKFCKHLGTIGNEHPNLVEFKKHFISWLRLNSKKSNPVKTTPAEWLA